MDRKIVYPGQIPLETDLLGTNQSAMVGMGKLAAAVLGTGGIVSGLTVGPNSPAALNVIVSAGEIYSLQNLEATAYSSLPADTAHTCIKQGIQLDPVTLPCPAPTTAGFSINYLIEATYADVDINATTLPYYNASNPTQAYSGPNNTGAQQATTRAGQVQLQVKAGIAAATGTQATPTTDAGFVALAVVTVANGQTTITAGNIVASGSAQVLTQSLLATIIATSRGRLLAVRSLSGSGTYTRTPGTVYVRIRQWGAGGGGGGGNTSTANGAGAGGGAGAYVEWFGLLSDLGPGPTYPYVTGAGGTAGVPGGTGGTGGSSSFAGTQIVAGGGTGGATGTSGSSLAGSGGTASVIPAGAVLLIPGQGGNGIFSGTSPAGQGGNSYGGLAGFARTTSGLGGLLGGGGGGGSITFAGGAGGAGSTIVEEYTA